MILGSALLGLPQLLECLQTRQGFFSVILVFLLIRLSALRIVRRRHRGRIGRRLGLCFLRHRPPPFPFAERRGPAPSRSLFSFYGADCVTDLAVTRRLTSATVALSAIQRARKPRNSSVQLLN